MESSNNEKKVLWQKYLNREEHQCLLLQLTWLTMSWLFDSLRKLRYRYPEISGFRAFRRTVQYIKLIFMSVFPRR